MKWRQFLASVVISIAFATVLLSQVTGEWVLEDYVECGISGIGVFEDDVYFVVQTLLEDVSPEVEPRIEILKMPTSGYDALELNSVYSVQDASRWPVLGDLLRSGNNWVFAENGSRQAPSDSFYLSLFDDDFNLIQQASTQGNIAIDPYTGFVFPNGDYIGLGTDFYPPDSLVRVKYTPSQSNLIEFKTFRPHVPVSFVTSMTYDFARNRFLVFHLGGISHLNDTLEVIQRFSGDILETEQHGTILADDFEYFSFGATRFLGSPDLRDLVLQKYDTSMNVLYSETYGRSGEDDYPFIVRSLDTLNDQYIIGGMYGGPLEFILKTPLSFFLAKYNADMERIWYQEFGGEHSYQIRGLHMIDDGRCLVYGYRVDSETDIRYPYLLIVNEDGLISSTEDIHEPPGGLIQVFSSDNSDLSFEAYAPLDHLVLHAMDGRLVKAFGNVDQGRHSYELSTVPPALYLLLARSNDGRTQSLKWLKQ